MSSEPITSHEYWAEVRSLVDSIATGGRADELTYDELGERLWETIDGHQWVIYTAYNYQVLTHSDNDAYAIEEFGVDSIVTDGQLNTARLAFGALYGDASDALWGRVETCDCGGGEECENCGGLGWIDTKAEAA